MFIEREIYTYVYVHTAKPLKVQILTLWKLVSLRPHMMRTSHIAVYLYTNCGLQ